MEGLSDGQTVFMIVRDGSESDAEAARAALADRGVELVDEAVLDVEDGDQQGQDDVMAVISERVKSSGATAALLVGNPSAMLRGLGDNGVLETLDQVWATDRDGLRNIGESVDRNYGEGVVTIDRLSVEEAWEEEKMVECRTVFETANPDIEVVGPAEFEEGNDDWGNAIRSYCSRFGLFEVVMDAAGPEPTNASLQEGIDNLGSFSIAGVPNASLGPGKYGADDSYRLSEYTLALGDGELSPITEITPVELS